MLLHGGMSKRERTRIKTRVRSAMAAQAATDGRFLGGRPPYGYQLIDAGPHPNPGKAAIGQQLRRVSPDPIAAPVARRIFDEFSAGSGLYGIASGLNADRIASPSAHAPTRNRHRAAGHGKWAKSAVRAILMKAMERVREEPTDDRAEHELAGALQAGDEMLLRFEGLSTSDEVAFKIVAAPIFDGIGRVLLSQHHRAGRSRPRTRGAQPWPPPAAVGDDRDAGGPWPRAGPRRGGTRFGEVVVARTSARTTGLLSVSRRCPHPCVSSRRRHLSASQAG